MIVSVSRGPTLVAEVSNPDMYRAIDLVVDKIEAQLKKHKGKFNPELSVEKGPQRLKWKVLKAYLKHKEKQFDRRNFIYEIN